MFDKLRLIFTHMMTEGNNSTFCPVRVIAAVAVAIYHVAAAVGVATHSIHIDMGALGDYVRQMIEMIGTAAASIGGKSLMKGDAPPEQQP